MEKNNLKNLKEFKGNTFGADWGRFPVDRKLKVEDIPNLQPYEVNVIGFIGDNDESSGNNSRKKRVKLSRLDRIPDKGQFNYLYDLFQAASGSVSSSSEAAEVKAQVVGESFNDLALDFLVKKAWKFKSFKECQKKMEFWCEHFGDLPVKEITPEMINKVKKDLKDSGLKGATVNKYLVHLRLAFNYAADPEELNWIVAVEHPMTDGKVKKCEEDSGRKRFLSNKEAKDLFHAITTSLSESLEDMVHFALNTGCRKSEALGLRWSDIDFDNDLIYFKQVKRNAVCRGPEMVDGQPVLKDGKPVFDIEKQVYEDGLKNGDSVKVLSMKNMGRIKDMLNDRLSKSNSHLVFPQNPRKAWENIIRNFGSDFPNLQWHDLRHTCASYIVQAGQSLEFAGKHLGHRSAASTQRYAHLSTGVTEETSAAISSRLYN